MGSAALILQRHRCLKQNFLCLLDEIAFIGSMSFQAGTCLTFQLGLSTLNPFVWFVLISPSLVCQHLIS